MRTYLECVPCFVRQTLDVARMVTGDPAIHEHVLRKTLRLIAETPFDRPPPWMAQRIHHLLREATGNADPYDLAKKHSNDLALSLYSQLKERVRASADPFATAVRLAIAGNVIDFGCRTELDDEEVHRAIADALSGPLDEAGLADLRGAVEAAEDILYLADNAGEIVFDRLLIEEMPMDRVTLVVRGGPVINDATRDDAESAGLTSLVRVMDNGSDAPGTIPEICTPSFRARLEQCDLVIAKGQGNYETLNDLKKDVFFLLRVKCPVIARDIGCELERMVLCRSGMPPEDDRGTAQERMDFHVVKSGTESDRKMARGTP